MSLLRGLAIGLCLALRLGAAAAGAADPYPEMIRVPGSTFGMGGERDDWSVPDEHPDRTVTLPAFSASRTEVTVAQYAPCARDGMCRAPQGPARSGELPVTGISWRDAQSYVAWLSARTGQRYRLLSEAEWERLARAGTETRFWWGDAPDRAYGNFGDDACCRGAATGADGFETIAPPGRFAPTPEGFHDLYGNVWEWVQDCYGPYDAAPADGSARDPDGCRVRVLRGGSYLFPAGMARASARYRLTPGARRPDVGFRVAMEPDL